MYLSWAEMIAVLPILEEADKAYTAAAAEKFIRTSQTNLLFSLGLRDKDLMKFGWERYSTLTTNFKDELQTLISDFEMGKFSTEDCMKIWKEKTGAYYQDIFQAGAAASGNPFYEKLGLTKKDQAAMSSARRAESKYWSNFLTDIKDPEHNQRFDYQERAGFYAESGKCILSSQALVYTVDGWKKIKDVKTGELVLTHRGRFKKVLAAIRHEDKAKPNEKVKVIARIPGKKKKLTIAVTEDHQFYTSDGWIPAKKLKGRRTFIAAVGCETCGKLMSLRGWQKYGNPRFCTEHLHEGNRGRIPDSKGKTYEELYGIEKARRLGRRIAEARLGAKFGTLEERYSGRELEVKHQNYERGARKSTEKKRKSGYYVSEKFLNCRREMCARKSHIEHLNSIATKGAARVKELTKGKTYEEIYGEKKAKEIRETLSIRAIQRRSSMLNAFTKPERDLKGILLELGLNYVEQKLFAGVGNVDFFLPEYGTILEADGNYWHDYPDGTDKDRRRDEKLTALGYTVLRFWESDLRRSPERCKERVSRLVQNHDGNYGLIEADVIDVIYTRMSNSTKYDLEVEEDNSFVCGGFVVHNSQFFGGLLAGAGDEVEIHWVLGVPMTCFTDTNLSVTTKDGAKKLGDVKQGDLVKTHSGKFKEVIRTAKFHMPLHDEYGNGKEEFLVKLIIKKNNEQIVELECTPNHRVLTNVGWVRADELTEEMEIFEDDEENRVVARLLTRSFIKKDYKKDSSVFLYDLEVDGDESYIVEGIIVHNSHCSVCPELAQSVYTWETLPFVPRCILHPYSNVYTDKGWKKIHEIEIGDFVLTHKKRFKKVIDVSKRIDKKLRKANWEECCIVIAKVNNKLLNLQVTKNHLFYTSVGWIEAKNLLGKKVYLSGKKCKNCGEIFVFCKREKQYCENCITAAAHKSFNVGMYNQKHCKGKTFDERFGKNKSKNIRRKLREHSFWKRNKGKSMEELFGEDAARRVGGVTKFKKGHIAWSKDLTKKTDSRLMKISECTRKSIKERRELDPEKYVNNLRKMGKIGNQKTVEQRKGKTTIEIFGKEKADYLREISRKTAIKNCCQQKNRQTKPELILKSMLSDMKLKFLSQHYFENVGVVDFFLPDFMIALEADGNYWHHYPDGTEQDHTRDLKLKEIYGVDTIRFWETELNKSQDACIDRLNRRLLNHANDYVLVEAEVVEIKKYGKYLSRIKYDISVEEDNSFVCRGFVVHNSGNTPCIFNCLCTLEILPKIKIGALSDMPGSATSEALSAAGRFAELFDGEGMAVGGNAQQTVEDYYGEMYKARQMMEITDGDELANWVERRIGINQELIDFLEARKYRAMPTVSVSDLVSTVRAAAGMPETALLGGMAEYEAGQEVLFIRANYSSFGKLTMIQNRLFFINGKDIRLPLQAETDILFGLTDTRITASPVENKKFFLKIFGKNKDIYDAFVNCYNEAIREGSRIPSELAWIKFRELYDNILGIGWVKKW